MYVVKADGRTEKFKPSKIINTCINADIDRSVARDIARDIEKQIKDGTTTQFIYKLILSELRKRRDRSSFLFTLREGIAKLDSVSFELYVKRILELHGYKCKWNAIINGRCVDHQVDIIARKEKLFLVECKHHINYHRFCSLGNVLQVQARLDDINDGYVEGKSRYNFDNAWLITNTKFSDHAKKYAKGKDIILSGWRYKDQYSLDRMIHSTKIFPVTILRCSTGTHKYLLSRGIITLRNLLSADNRILKNIEKHRLEDLKRQASRLLS